MGSPPTAQPSPRTWQPGGLQNAAAFREVVISPSADPNDLSGATTLSSGTGVPTHTRGNGSLYWNNTTGDRYVRASGLWAVDSAGGLELVTEPGAGMSAGDLVYISGNDGTDPEVTLATNTDLDTRSTLVLLEDIATGAVGAATGIAEVGGLNTLAGSVGDKVYLDTAGGWTLVAPTAATDIVQEVGVIKVDSATVGVILFYPGYTKLQGIEASDIMGLTATAAELNYLDLTAAIGTVTASEALVVDASKDIGELGVVQAAQLLRDSNDLDVTTTTTGSVNVDGVDGVNIESSGGVLRIGADAVAQAVAIGTGAAARAITIGNAASASLDMESGVGGATLQADTTIDIDAGGAVSIDAVGASNLTNDSGQLLINTTTAGNIDVFAAQVLGLRGVTATSVLDGADPSKIMGLDASAITTGNARTLTMADMDVSLDQLTTAPTLTPGAEAADVIAITFASPVGSVERYIVKALDDTTMQVNTAAFTIAETGVGAEVSPTARGQLIFTTDASGDATVSVTDVAGASGKTVWVTVEPLFASADQAQACAPVTVSITFD
jgi:hypothetical protein